MTPLRLLLDFGLLVCIADSYNLDASRPIIYEVPDDDEKSSYFGMSVAIRPKAASLNDTWTVQIGAPRGREDGGGAGAPGAVYRCRTHGPCRRFAVHRGPPAVGGQGARAFAEKKDAAWVGVAMDVALFGTRERSVVCGHRWMNENLKNPENIDVTYLVTGVCYLQDLLDEASETPVRRLLPLTDKDEIYTPKPYAVDLSTYHWGLGQAGISVKFEGPSVLMGAPGVTHWIGSVVRQKENSDAAVGDFARTQIARRSRYPYLGYSVAFGRFYGDGEIWYAAGAPRSANYRGEVFTFRFKGSSGDVRLRSDLVGATFGEYFGSSLATADLNGDGFDDLIVGAPLFSAADPDEGRIYVYLGSARGDFLAAAQAVDGRAGGGRFGTCVVSAGDLDRDGYDDVVVGAPYEDDRRGAIYVYGGSSEGLRTERGQRIGARDLHPHLRGFGVSISSAVDVDGNGYPDVAVGAYLSGHVVLMRSRPVVSLHPRIRAGNATLIDRRASYFNVTVCSGYAGANAPDHVDVIRTVEIDPLHGRGKLDPKASDYRKPIRLTSNQIACEVLPVLLDVSTKNFSPLQIAVRNEIDPSSDGKGSSLLVKGERTEGEDAFPKARPVGSKAEAWKEIPFAGVCGPDLVCDSDLELSCAVPDFRGGSYALGSTEFLTLFVDVKNRGEPALETKIKIWSNLKLKRRDHDAASPETPRKVHWLHHEGVLAENYQTDFSFQIALAELTEETRFDLTAEIFSSSSEADFSDNKCRFSVKLRSDAILDFYASSSIASAYLRKNESDRTLNVTHYYEVQKTGVTPIKDAALTIYVPFRYGKEFLGYEMETAEWMHFSRGSENPPIEDDARPEQPASKEDRPPTNRTLFLDCSAAETECDVVKIFFARGIPAGSSSYVKILITLNVTAVDEIKMEKDIVHLSTTGVLEFSKYLEAKPRRVEESASTSLYAEEGEARVDARVVALSVLAGAFLLSLIVTGLARSNFFRRAKKEELKELKELKDADASFVFFATGGGLPDAGRRL